MLLRVWTSRWAGWGALTLALAALLAVGARVDLSPKVEGDFFFADDDPQMQASRAVADRFPAGAQLILRVADLRGDPVAYEGRVGALTQALLEVEGVEQAASIATDDPASPFFGRILTTPDSTATNIILQLGEVDPEVLLPRVEGVIDELESGDLDVVVSGVPAIVELIRRSLYRDLIVFSGAAVVVFALLIGIVYRDPVIVVGTLATCLVSVGTTLLLVNGAGVGIGLLTANLVTIVFVLTLSHVVFLTANWRRRSSEAGVDRATMLSRGLRDTWEGSFWSMVTTLLGFASLLVATARPLRELGIAGVIGSLTALLTAYLVYPAFLGRWVRIVPGTHGRALPVKAVGGRRVLPVAALALLAFGLGVPNVDTDPGLLTYFAEGSELREGLARIDADGGSSTLDVVVADPTGESLVGPAPFARLEALQTTFEADPAVGVVLSPVVLIEHARTVPFAGLLPVEMLLNIASTPALGSIGLGFVTPERTEARFSLRMREAREESRVAVLRRIRSAVEDAGLEPVIVAGLYDLQAQLGRLIGSSLRIGIGGLLGLFFIVALVVGRGVRVAAAMWLCLATIPVVILGTFGHLRIAIDIITSPAANIALAVGADSMIHLVVRVRLLAVNGDSAPWRGAVGQIRRPVLGATAIICAGFGIFALSSFPPTRRFGMAVIVGTLAAATLALIVLPKLACIGRPGDGTLSGPPAPATHAS